MTNTLYFKHYADYPTDIERSWTEELQGVAHDDGHWFISQKNKIWRMPINVPLHTNINDADPAHGILNTGIPSSLSTKYDHFGDLDCFNGILFVGLEKTDSDTTTSFACFDANTLGFLGSAEAPEQKNHLPWCAVNPGNGLLYSSAFDDVSVLNAYSFSLSNGQLNIAFDHSEPLLTSSGDPLIIDAIQGGTFGFISNQIYLFLASNDDDDRGIHAFSWPELRHLQNEFIDTEWLGFGEEIEGIAFWDLSNGQVDRIRGHVHLIELDNDSLSSDDLKAFRHYSVYVSQYIANKNPNKREVHKAGCKWIDLMKSENKIPYDSLKDALSDGYDGCAHCLSEWNTR